MKTAIILGAAMRLCASTISLSGSGGAYVSPWNTTDQITRPAAACSQNTAAGDASTHFTLECSGADVSYYRPLWAQAAYDSLEVSLTGRPGQLTEAGYPWTLEFPALLAWFNGAMTFTGSGSGTLDLDAVLEPFDWGISNAARGAVTVGGVSLLLYPQSGRPQHISLPIVFGESVPYSIGLSDNMRLEFGDSPAGRVRLSNLVVTAHNPEPATWLLLASALLFLVLRRRRV